MPETLSARPAIEAAHGRPRGIRLAELPSVGKIDLRGDPQDRAFMAAVGRVLDLVLPGEPNTAASKGQLSALWLGPDQWLLTCPHDDVPFFMTALREALGEAHAALTDVSDGRVAMRLTGPNARDVLAKACPLDLHPRAFGVGRVAQSLLAKADVLIHQVEDGAKRGPVFDLFVARSFAHYLWAWLEDAGLEYGFQVEPPA